MSLVVPLADWKPTRLHRKLVNKVIKSGRLTYGPMTKQFEEEFAEIHGQKYALFTSSGTSALKIAIGCLKEEYGWKDGDEVIIPAVTFVATMNAVIMNNLKPVLVDVDYTINIDPSKIEEAITKKTRCLLPVHLFGLPADMTSIMKIARKHKLKVVEDSCETMFVHEPVGDIACFSTYVAHLITTGVGGIITTNKKKLATKMRSIMFHGRDESYLSIDDLNVKTIEKRFWFPRFGYSDRSTEMQAALGIAELKRWKKNLKKRQEVAEYYVSELHGEWPDFPRNHALMFFPLDSDHRDELMIYLEKHGVETRTMMPLINQPVAKPYAKGKYPMAKYVGKNGLLIPCHPYMSRKQIQHVVKTMKGYHEFRRTR